jgi:phosphatidylinositol alpha-1,6-mannosyltransferase
MPLTEPVKGQRVLVVGRMEALEAYKGHHELLSAWPYVLSIVPNARLEIVGKGSLVPKLKKLASNLGIEHAVEFKGFVSETELAELYRQATAFALPSRGEGFGLVYIEAMKNGLPVIASIHDAGSEIVVNGETGILVDLDAPGCLGEAIVRILSEPLLAAQLGAAGKRRFERHFTSEAFEQRLLSELNLFLVVNKSGV